MLQNSLLRCQRATIESDKPTSRIRYCVLGLIFESILRVGSLENSFATQSTESGQTRTDTNDPNGLAAHLQRDKSGLATEVKRRPEKARSLEAKSSN
jgi:hypothetical protein